MQQCVNMNIADVVLSIRTERPKTYNDLDLHFA